MDTLKNLFSSEGYSLEESFKTKADFIKGWRCYLGRTTADPTALHNARSAKNTDTSEYEGYDWYAPSSAESLLESNGLWLEDPTQGYLANYNKGCENISDLIKDSDNDSVILDVKYITKPQGKTGATQTLATLRIEGKKIYNGGVFIMDVNQIPYACGSWPAFWLVGSEPGQWDESMNKVNLEWPNYGEIDIIEQINGNGENFTTLHTKENCKTVGSINGKPVDYKEEGSDAGDSSVSNDCNKGDGAIGCSLHMGSGTGGELDGDGGVYACEWIPDDSIKFWFWKRSDVPSTFTADMSTVDTSQWSSTATVYTEHNLKESCSENYFQNLHLIINTTVCGQWAGNTPNETGDCKWAVPGGKNKTLMDGCMNYVMSNALKGPDMPELAQWRWDIRYLNTYTNKSSLSYWKVGIPAAVLLIIIIGLFVYMSKSKAPPRPLSRLTKTQ